MGRGMSRFGRRVSLAWHRGGPVITVSLIGLCIIVWIIEEVTTPFPDVHARFLENGVFAPLLAASRPWTAITSVFFHAPGLLHIGLNMLTLWFLGATIEHALGHWTYLAVYLISGLGGSMGVALYSKIMALVASASGGATSATSATSAGASMISTYGASGAIFGLFGALIPVYMTALRGSSERAGTMRSLFILIILGIVQSVIDPQIAWQAHLGGFVVGWIVTSLIWWWPSWRSRVRWLTARVWITFACVLVCITVIAVMCWCIL